MKKILIVEDDEFLGDTLQTKFQKAGYDVKFVNDGAKVMDTFKTFVPNLILLDLLMPVKDGFLLLEELKADSKYKSIPVVVISNVKSNEDITKVKKLGAKEYIVKSDLVIDDLVKKVDSYI